MRLKKQQWHDEKGAVALFVVVFATLLMIIITLSFIQLMIKDQQQATASDLSQSAYDSAQAGVEDAKRLLLLGQACRSNSAPSTVNCSAVIGAIDSGECNTVARIFGDPNTETLIQQDEGDKALQQAYTCVTIDSQTADYKGQIEMNQSNVVPLKGTGEFNQIRISWFTRDDTADAGNSMNVGFPSSGPSVSLPRVGSGWGLDNPALLRTQFMQTGSSFTLTDFDDNQPGGKSNANTLFLYPSETGASNMSFALDGRRSTTGAPQQVDCVSSFSLREYACEVTIALPAPVNGSAANRGAYLRLSALYNGAHYKVELLNSGTPVLFDNIQPEVDSTGRANDMFRRVKSRIELKSDFMYPEATIDLGGDLCKNFIITADDADYQASSTCTP